MKLLNWIYRERISIKEIQIDDARKELLVFGSYALLYVLIVWFFAVLIRKYPLPLFGNTNFTTDVWYVVFIKIVFLLIIPIAIYRRFGYPLASLFNLTKPGIVSVLVPFAIGLAINFSYVAAIGPLLIPSNLFKILIGMLLPLIAAAIPEELFYRVILQTRIEKLGGWCLSIVASSILFSLFHFPSRYHLSAGVEGTAGDLGSVFLGTLIPTFILGLILGFLWNRYRNIFLLIALHYGIDLLPSVSSMLGVAK